MGRRRRVVFSGGGTGGHLFPALAVAEALRRRRPDLEIVFIGARRGIESRVVPGRGFRLIRLPVRGLKGRGPWGRWVSVLAAGLSLAAAWGWMVWQRPALVVGVGGYASGPAVLAGRWAGAKIMLLEQNHFPGATNRFLARWAHRICVPSEEARRHLGGRGIITGNPVAPELFELPEVPERRPLHLLVVGGSRGARPLNEAMMDALPRLASWPEPPRIAHQTGSEDLPRVRAAYTEHYAGECWEASAFFEDMPRRLGWADLVLCRAGAMTLAELTAAGRGAILVPLPHAADDHQTYNARTLAEAGAAEILPQPELDAGALIGRLETLSRRRDRLRAMGRAARRLAVPDATDRIVSCALGLLDEAGPGDPGKDEGGARVS